MTDPLSGTGAATGAVTGVTIIGLWTGTGADVLIAAFAGAVVFVLSSAATDYSIYKRLAFFVVSFLLGVLSADMSATVIGHAVNRLLGASIEVSSSIGAFVASATIIKVSMWLIAADFPKFGRRGGDT